MSQRVIRVNELVKREISDILHTRYHDHTAGITVTEASVSPNLREAHIYYSVLGDEADVREAEDFFQRRSGELRKELGRRIVLKYLPKLLFKPDEANERGTRINALLDEMGLDGEQPQDDLKAT